MTKPEILTPLARRWLPAPAFRISDFGFLSSFVIRHSGFGWSVTCVKGLIIPQSPTPHRYRAPHVAAAFQFRQSQQPVQLGFDLGKGPILQLDPEPVPDDVANLLPDIQHAEVVFAGDIHAEKQLRVVS